MIEQVRPYWNPGGESCSLFCSDGVRCFEPWIGVGAGPLSREAQSLVLVRLWCPSGLDAERWRNGGRSLSLSVSACWSWNLLVMDQLLLHSSLWGDLRELPVGFSLSLSLSLACEEGGGGKRVDGRIFGEFLIWFVGFWLWAFGCGLLIGERSLLMGGRSLVRHWPPFCDIGGGELGSVVAP